MAKTRATNSKNSTASIGFEAKIQQAIGVQNQNLVRDAATNPTSITLSQLESHLWESANILRGTVDAADFKSYVFPLLFFKRLSDMQDEEHAVALKEFEGDEKSAMFFENYGFQIPGNCHWADVRNVVANVGQALQTAMRGIEQANPHTLYGIFGDAQWMNKDRLSDAMLRDLIEHFSTLELTVANLPEDELGQGYEYLIKKFADEHLQRVVRAYQEFKDEPGFTRVVPIEEIRAKDGNLSIPLYVGGEAQAQTDAAPETATTARLDALKGWLESSRKVRDSLQTLLTDSVK